VGFADYLSTEPRLAGMYGLQPVIEYSGAQKVAERTLQPAVKSLVRYPLNKRAPSRLR